MTERQQCFILTCWDESAWKWVDVHHFLKCANMRDVMRYVLRRAASCGFESGRVATWAGRLVREGKRLRAMRVHERPQRYESVRLHGADILALEKLYGDFGIASATRVLRLATRMVAEDLGWPGDWCGRDDDELDEELGL